VEQPPKELEGSGDQQPALSSGIWDAGARAGATDGGWKNQRRDPTVAFWWKKMSGTHTHVFFQ